MIKEVIVVEGRSDTVAVKRAVDADTIETGGSAIPAHVLKRIKLAHQKRGVIIFTDPDYPGERIRKIVSQAVPGCKHAFITQDEGRGKRNLGVENATPDTIRKALENVYTQFTEPHEEEITFQDLVDAGLVGAASSSERRKRLGEFLGIGYANAKQIHKRLNMFQISKRDFLKALEEQGGECIR
jgi:ribonuclease M5